MPCPLKEAALDAPNQPAIRFNEKTITFKEFDQLVESTPPVATSKEKNSLELILKFFSSMRKEKSFFPVNPRLPMDVPKISESSPTLYLFTSGSSGKPKIAVIPYESLIENAKDAFVALDLRPNDQWKLTLPLYHVGGISILLRAILARACIVLDDSPMITHLSFVPTHLYRFSPVYRNLRCLLLGGAPISKIPVGLPIHTTYGLTEMSSIVTLDGKVLPGREVKIASDGEILVKGPMLFKGYWKEPPHRGWFKTGDLGHFENDRLIVTGRKDWMFISGGENIQPEEVEAALLEDPEVYEAAVFGVDDPEFGKRPIAVVRADSKYSFKKMLLSLKTRLTSFKIPTQLIFVSEMPTKSNFKLDRFILSQMITAQLDENKKMFKAGQKKTPNL